MTGDQDKLEKVLNKWEVTLKKEEQEQEPKSILKTVFKKIMSCADCILDMIITHLPSPKTAQQYRIENIYNGCLDEEEAKAMIDIHINVCPGHGKDFIAFGRIFSGTLRCGDEVQILTPEEGGKSGKKKMKKAIVKGVKLWMGATMETVPEMSCGNTLGILGLGAHILKQATVTSIVDREIAQFKSIKFCVAPIVEVAIKPKHATDIAKLLEGMKKIQDRPAGEGLHF